MFAPLPTFLPTFLRPTFLSFLYLHLLFISSISLLFLPLSTLFLIVSVANDSTLPRKGDDAILRALEEAVEIVGKNTQILLEHYVAKQPTDEFLSCFPNVHFACDGFATGLNMSQLLSTPLGRSFLAPLSLFCWQTHTHKLFIDVYLYSFVQETT